MTAPQYRDPIVLSDLSAEYPPRGASSGCVALRGISLRVRPDEVLGVLGESGSGKSTLARIISARAAGAGPVPRITGGDATVMGYSMRRLKGRERTRLTFHVGYLQQDAGARLDRGSTVADLVAAPIYERDKHFSRREAGVRVASMLDSVQLSLGVLQKYPYELSSGQQQRVAIAQALVLGPSLLVADEPTAGIDVTVRDSVVDLLAQLHGMHDFAAVIVSHDARVLRNATATVAVLQSGSLVGYGTMEEVFTAPIHPYVSQLAEALRLSE
ncbi:ATP-binding cassette domain-containing protein [Humibacter albus]|jgi:ABC-type glutathione transport system ATPase component|uniref:ATP-binding cassette domain-containing protein n=1 Tax=Humibacter albus TaxID=427754 RepID=UPI0003B3074B|nr:ATP-binding cassette domain-containing protein [Humibacter albus]